MPARSWRARPCPIANQALATTMFDRTFEKGEAMARQLVVDPKKCVGCRTCELVCSFKHNEEFNPRLSNVSVFHYEEAAITVPIMCLQCDEASCAAVCPTGALRRNTDGVIAHDASKCIVCKMCVNACPLGNVSYSPAKQKIFKCDLCDGETWCAKYCPTGAISVVDPNEVPDKKQQAADKLKAAVEEVCA